MCQKCCVAPTVLTVMELGALMLVCVPTFSYLLVYILISHLSTLPLSSWVSLPESSLDEKSWSLPNRGVERISYKHHLSIEKFTDPNYSLINS